MKALVIEQLKAGATVLGISFDPRGTVTQLEYAITKHLKEEHKQVQMFAQYPQQPAVQQSVQASVQTTTQDDLGRHVGYLMCCYMNGAKQGPFDAFVYTKKKLGIQDLNYAWALECKTAFDNSFWG